jgi:hypothetical protein
MPMLRTTHSEVNYAFAGAAARDFPLNPLEFRRFFTAGSTTCLSSTTFPAARALTRAL